MWEVYRARCLLYMGCGGTAVQILLTQFMYHHLEPCQPISFNR